MKVNYPERIEDTGIELKIIMSQQRTIGDKLRRAIESQEGLSQQAQTCETQTPAVI